MDSHHQTANPFPVVTALQFEPKNLFYESGKYCNSLVHVFLHNIYERIKVTLHLQHAGPLYLRILPNTVNTSIPSIAHF